MSVFSGSRLYINRKVVRPNVENENVAEGRNAIDVIPCLNRYPLQMKGAHRLLYPYFMSPVPLFPCADTNLTFLSGDYISVPRRGRVYFEIIQGCWKQYIYSPSIAAVIVELDFRN